MERQGRQRSKSSTGPLPVEARNEQKARERRNRRESIESFVVVFVAFLLWSFEAEGFVIPTGSMAPTLMGRHKEIICPQCGYVYTVNADCEVDSNGSGAATGIRVTWGTCENCRYETRVDDAPSASGDRIYTMKKGLELPFLPAAGRVGPEALGGRRLQVARGARGPLHQAPGRHAERDPADSPGRPLA